MHNQSGGAESPSPKRERAGARVLFLNHSLIPAVIEVAQPLALATGNYGAP